MNDKNRRIFGDSFYLIKEVAQMLQLSPQDIRRAVRKQCCPTKRDQWNRHWISVKNVEVLKRWIANETKRKAERN